MKSLIATAALSLLALSTIAEAQPQKNQFITEAQLLASLPTQDVEFIASTPKSQVNIHSLLTSLPTFDANAEVPTSKVNVASLIASLPTFDTNVEMPTSKVNVANLMASLPTFDANVEAPALLVNVSKLMASLPTFDANVEAPASKINSSKLMASLPTMDETTVTSVLVDTDVKHLDTKNYQTAHRLTEE